MKELTVAINNLIAAFKASAFSTAPYPFDNLKLKGNERIDQ